MTDRREPFSIRLGNNRLVRSLFLGIATLAAALGFPVKVEPPPPRKTPVEVVRDDDDGSEGGDEGSIA